MTLLRLKALAAWAVACLLVAGALAALPEQAQERAREGYAFSTPAAVWSEALPIGNGRLAALIQGEATEEVIPLNEESYWAPPKPQPINPEGAALLPEMRRLLFAGREAEAAERCEQRFLRGGDAVSPYLPVATLRLRHELPEGVRGYKRGLHLDEGLAYTTFQSGSATHWREAFAAYEDDALCFTYRADQPGTLTFSVALEFPGAVGSASLLPPNRLYLTGSSGAGGVAFDALVEVTQQGGTLEQTGESLRVVGAERASVCVAIYTDFNRLAPRRPLTRSRLTACRTRLDVLGAKGLEAVRARHIRAFSARYGRSYVVLDGGASRLPLEAALAQARTQRRLDPAFLLLNADFFRYLLISASRPGGLPANLQGKWNPLPDPPWKSDWHLDINLSMCYWPAGAWGLADLAEPLTSLAEIAFPASREVARTMLGVEEGLFLGTCTDLWGTCAPFRWSCWGMYVSGGAWLLQDALEAWRYGGDETLPQRLLPLLRAQSRFYLAWLVRHPQSRQWVSGPVASPENTYRTAEGGSAAIDMGPAHEQMLVAATLGSFIELASALTPEDELIGRAAAVLSELAQPQIGPDGALQEWSRAYGEAEPGHRHLSFAYALMPGHAWSARRTPTLAEALRKRLDLRKASGHHLMGWSLGHMACLRARLNDGEGAMAALDPAAQYLTPNLFTTSNRCPQVADLGGVPAALNEMLLRSERGLIEVLPALPERLRAGGSFRLWAVDGMEVEAAWRAGRLERLILTAHRRGRWQVYYNGVEAQLAFEPGQRRVLLAGEQTAGE